MTTTYGALVQDRSSGKTLTITLDPELSHEAMRRAALRFGRSKGVASRRRGDGNSPALYVVTVDAGGIATDLDMWTGEDWRYTAGHRHVHAARKWAVKGQNSLFVTIESFRE